MPHQARVHGIVIDPGTQMPVIVLHVDERDVAVPIGVGLYEANGIALGQEGIETPRPMTHDLLKSTIEKMGGTVQGVTLTRVTENTVHAAITISTSGSQVEIDARPSDAIALAVRAKAPIQVTEEVIEKLGTSKDLKELQSTSEDDLDDATI